MSATNRDYSCVRLERRNWVTQSGEPMSSLRAITDRKTAPVIMAFAPNGPLAPEFVSEGNCRTVICSMPAAEFDSLEVLVSQRGGESAVPWPISEPRR